MSLLFVLDYRFAQTPDGAVWTDTVYDQTFWNRYLEVFDSVLVASRVKPVDHPDAGWRRVDRPGITVHVLPYYLGPLDYAAHHRAVRRAIAGAITDTSGAVLLRVASQLATVAVSELESRGRAFALEVGGDPDAAFAPGAVRHPLRAFFRRWYTTQLRQQCLEASAVLYVSEGLRRAYPARPDAAVVVCSDADLADDAFVAAPRRHERVPVPRLVCVGSLEHDVKGISILIDACERLAHDGLDIEVTIVGGGRLRPAFERQAERAGLGSRVSFVGTLPAGAAVRDHLDRASLFVLPSRTEGMPRALLEAMARGLPCVGSAVGGIGELLSAEDTVPPGDATALARLIAAVLRDRDRLDRMSDRNLATSRLFAEIALAPRRRAWYEHLRASGG